MERKSSHFGGLLVVQEETQEQVRLLIKGNSASKTRLCRSPGEVSWDWKQGLDRPGLPGMVLSSLSLLLLSHFFPTGTGSGSAKSGPHI